MMGRESPPTASGAAAAGNACISTPPLDDDNLQLNVMSEEAEIARLQLPTTPQHAQEEPNKTEPAATGEDAVAAANQPPPEDERIAKIEFDCAACGMHEVVHYYGRTPPFLYGVEFLEDTYVLRDPFQPPPPRWKPRAEYFVAVGAQCSQCGCVVCKDTECSFHYTRTLCLKCAPGLLKSLPLEARARLSKQLTAK